MRYIDLIESVQTKHVITADEAKIIRVAAAKAASRRITRIEVGIKANSEGDMGMNLLMLSPDGTGLETFDFRSWADLRKGFPMLDGRAALDLFIYSNEGLETNIHPIWDDGVLISVIDQSRVLWELP